MDETQDEIAALKAEVVELKARLEAVEAACRAFAVVYAIPRLPDQPRTGPAPADSEPEK